MNKSYIKSLLLLLLPLLLSQQVKGSPYSYMKHGVDISPWKEGLPPDMCLDGSPSSMKGDIFFHREYDVITGWTPKFTVRGYYEPKGDNAEEYKTGAGASLESFRPPCWDYLDAKTTSALAKIGHANGKCDSMCDLVKDFYRNGFSFDNESVKCTDENNCIFNAEDEPGVISVCDDPNGRCKSGSFADYVEAELAARRGAEAGAKTAEDSIAEISNGGSNTSSGSGSTSGSGSGNKTGNGEANGQNDRGKDNGSFNGQGNSDSDSKSNYGAGDSETPGESGNKDTDGGLDWSLGTPPDIEDLLNKLKETIKRMAKEMNDRIKINYSPSGSCEPLNIPNIPFMGSSISGGSLNFHCDVLNKEGEQVRKVIIDLSKIAGAIFLMRGL